MARARLIIALIGGLVGATESQAQDTSTNSVELIKQLQQRIVDLEQKVKQLENQPRPEDASKQRIEELDQKVKALERDRKSEAEGNAAKAKQGPKIIAGEKGFAFASASGDFSIQLKGVLQIDSRSFFGDAGIVGNDGFLVRRARPILQGTVYRDFDFLLVPDFGGTGSPQIFDAYVNYRFRPELQVQVGKYKVPVGLEVLQPDRDLFFNERALPSDLVPSRDLGAELQGDLFADTVSYAAGIFNGVADGRNSNNADFEDDKAFAGRLFFQPFKPRSSPVLRGFGFGLGGSYESQQTTNSSGLPVAYATVGQQPFFTYASGVVAAGDHWRLAPQAYYSYGPFSLLGEYIISNQKVERAETGAAARLNHAAWQVAAGWVLTGEDAAFAGGVVPRRPFKPAEGGWGALQLVGRYSELRLDDNAFPVFASPETSARSAQEFSVGLNWWLNRNIRVSASFSHTTFEGGGAAGASGPAMVTRKDENVLFTRMQLAF